MRALYHITYRQVNEAWAVEVKAWKMPIASIDLRSMTGGPSVDILRRKGVQYAAFVKIRSSTSVFCGGRKMIKRQMAEWLKAMAREYADIGQVGREPASSC